MARAKKIVESPEWDISIYQDDLTLYTVHTTCGPRAQWWTNNGYDGEWICVSCDREIFIEDTKKSELRVGPRRKASEIEEWAAPWVGARVEASIKR